MTGELNTDAARARAELAAALNELEAKLNVPKRVRQRIARIRAENPMVAVGIVAGAAISAGALVWLAVRRGQR